MTSTQKGYIKLNRKILNWELYNDKNAFRVFVHLLLKASYADGVVDGIAVARGEVVTSLRKLAAETGLSVAEVRNTLKRLERTQTITQQSHRNYTVISLQNYDRYQAKEHTKEHTKGVKKNTPNSLANIYNNIYKKDSLKKEERNVSLSDRPSVDDVQSFCQSEGLHIAPERFFAYYDARGWCINGQPIADWRVVARSWNAKERPASTNRPTANKGMRPWKPDEPTYDLDAFEADMMEVE